MEYFLNIPSILCGYILEISEQRMWGLEGSFYFTRMFVNVLFVLITGQESWSNKRHIVRSHWELWLHRQRRQSKIPKIEMDTFNEELPKRDWSQRLSLRGSRRSHQVGWTFTVKIGQRKIFVKIYFFFTKIHSYFSLMKNEFCNFFV